ncbi:MAG TPA: flagellar biosynthesis protein FlhA [Acidimicrobiales bacterium]|nr:flagellar biosynthesis protein FlhA [Acidimicrobiales bacterium]
MNSNRFGQLAIPGAIVAVVVMMVVPLPTVVVDMLLAVNMSGAVLILLMSMHVRRPLDFSVFPTMLLVCTMFRLALNVSATRLVLLHGFAGNVIEAFGHFVIGGSVVVGLVLFFILVVIQFMVITKGSERVAEVAARFTLDAMPGKQMAIDADLNAGMIDEEEARRRRRDVAAEADFYGAMDGASKFVKGDAIAAIVITTVNLIGGFVVGVIQHHLSIGDAVKTYSLLSVGDGMVSQIPALMISVSAGIITTRAATDDDLGTDVLRQFSAQKQAVRAAGVVACLIAIVPGLPKVPFLVVGALLLVLAARLKDTRRDEAAGTAVEAAPAGPSPDSPEALMDQMRVDALSLEVSVDLIDLVEPGRGGDLLDRMRALRRKLALELGVVIPLVRTRDNFELAPGTYVLRVHGVELGRGEAVAGCVLAIGDNLQTLPGAPTHEPVFGLAAKWVPIEFRQQAELQGCTVVDRASVITTHLAELVRTNAGKLLTRQDVKALLDVAHHTDPAVVDDLAAAQVSLGELHVVLRGLLEEQVAIRDLVRILEAVTERARTTRDPEALTEAARLVLGPAISADLAVDGRLAVMTLEPMVEHGILERLRAGDGGTFLALEPDRAENLVRMVAAAAHDMEQRGEQAVLVCASQIRSPLRRLVRSAVPLLRVLSYAELGPQLTVETIGVVSDGVHAAV